MTGTKHRACVKDENFHRTRITGTGFVLTAAGALLALFLIQSDGLAQQTPAYNTGLGVQIGQPAGVTFKHYMTPTRAADLSAAWDLNNFFFVQGHYLFENSFAEAPRLKYFLGPGAFIGLHQRDRGDDTVIGFSGNLGVALVFQRLDVFLQVTPRVSLAPATNSAVGGGLGVRFFF